MTLSGAQIKEVDEAFFADKKLAAVTIKTTKLTKDTVGAGAFKGTHKKSKAIVPKKVRKKYKKWLKKKRQKLK